MTAVTKEFKLVTVNERGTGLYRTEGVKGTLYLSGFLFGITAPQSLQITGEQSEMPVRKSASVSPEEKERIKAEKAAAREAAKAERRAKSEEVKAKAKEAADRVRAEAKAAADKVRAKAKAEADAAKVKAQKNSQPTI